ncbi:MAG: carboxypeptidase regulatory-like domain-containing protein [Planctomycetota bacterium]|nr:MAG: carboxypeptidase regulatory-like domain-containing protein [Planctomycetota bacterium]
MLRFRYFPLFVLPIALALTGCQGEKGPRTVPAKGIVTLDGEPVEGAAIVFIDENGLYPARGYSDENGRFSLDAFEYKTGAVPGTYKVVVTKTINKAITDPAALKGEEAEHAGEEADEIIVNALPQKYAIPNGLLTFTIPEEGTDNLIIELKSGD